MGVARADRRLRHGYHRHLHRQQQGRDRRRRQDAHPQHKASFRAVEKEGEKSPDFRVSAADMDIGAAWKKTSREGRDYISVKLDDPSFPAPVYATLSETDTAGEYALIWSR